MNTNALTVDAATLGLPATAGTSLAQGRFLNAATAREPVCVLGVAAAQLLGIDRSFPGERIWTGNMWLYVAGILKPDVLSPDIDSSVLVGYPFAGETTSASTVTPPRSTSRPSTARSTGSTTCSPPRPTPKTPAPSTSPSPHPPWSPKPTPRAAFNSLFLGLGAVALLVGAIGVANIMVISVLERRSEIGLRRALGATKGHIRTQFLSEAILLAVIGGIAGHRDRRARHRHLRPRQRLGHRHPRPGLGRRHRRRHPHRRRRRATARPPRRPPLTHPSPLEPLSPLSGDVTILQDTASADEPTLRQGAVATLADPQPYRTAAR